MMIRVLVGVSAAAVALVAFVVYSGYAGPIDLDAPVAGSDRYIVPPEKIRSGGPPKDGIPSIDSPVFADISEADIPDTELVIGLQSGDDIRAYPFSILVWHEIVNDIVGGTPVAVTYCPLCFTSQVFDRTVSGNITEFGTSGKLYNSNLVMYDRNTDSEWSQALGLAISGTLAGQRLEAVPFDVATWGDWSSSYPETVVLTTQTGYQRPYGTDPYGSYYTDPYLRFPVDHLDDRLHPKEIIVGFESGDTYKAYLQKIVESQGPINDTVEGVDIVLFSPFDHSTRIFSRSLDGMTLDFEASGDGMADSQTGSVWNAEGQAVSGPLQGESLERLPTSPGFWFEWYAFHPDTLLHGEPGQ